jgi:hypothetical protein
MSIGFRISKIDTGFRLCKVNSGMRLSDGSTFVSTGTSFFEFENGEVMQFEDESNMMWSE